MQDFKKYKPYSIRLKHYNYSSSGEYFVTICTKDFKCIFGEVVNGGMVLNELGKIANQFWLEIPKHFPNVELDIYQVMPNHVHGMIRILFDGNFSDSESRDAIHRVSEYAKKGGFAGLKNPMLNPNSLSKIVNWFKGRVTFEINKILKNKETTNTEDAMNRVSTGKFQWQPGFYDEIIKNEKHYSEVYDYILSNPSKWEEDRNNPKNLKS